MTLRTNDVFALAALLATFVAGLLVFGVLSDADRPMPADPQQPRADADADTYVQRANASLEKVRETEDPSFYPAAEQALAEARRREPRGAAVALGMGSLAMSKHDFRAGLEWGERARRLAPELIRPLGLIADAQIELGRYSDAERTLQRMVDLKPGLPAYSRISYFRELNGDLDGAAEAMRLAVTAAGSRPRDVADVRALLGHLELARGNTAQGERLFRSVLYSQPAHAKALDGLADVEMAKGRIGGALARWRKLSAAVPSPHFATDVVELTALSGDRAGTRAAVERVHALDRRLAAAGVNVATESAVFEADWGSPRKALALARKGYADAPSVGRADALGWALTRNGRPAKALPYAREAMRLGTLEPMFLYHGALAARDAGRTGLARTWLTRLLADYPGFSPLYEPRAKRILLSLG